MQDILEVDRMQDILTRTQNSIRTYWQEDRMQSQHTLQYSQIKSEDIFLIRLRTHMENKNGKKISLCKKLKLIIDYGIGLKKSPIPPYQARSTTIDRQRCEVSVLSVKEMTK